MATTSETVTLTSVCAGGGHLVFTGTGAKSATVNAVLDDLTEPLTDEEMLAFVKVIVKMAKAGRTLSAAKTLLQAGVAVTV
jgi:hypothetical protein